MKTLVPIPLFAAVFLVAWLAVLLGWGIPCAADNINVGTSRDNFLNALNNEVVNSDGDPVDIDVTQITLGGTMTIRKADPDDPDSYLNFVPDDIDRTLTITSSGSITIQYSGSTANTAIGDEIDYHYTITSGGTLIFDKAATLSGGYSYAGLVVVDGGSLQFKGNATLNSNNSFGNGGAVSLNTGTLSVTGDTTFSNNNALGGFGGAIEAGDATLTFAKFTAGTNRATGDGGALSLHNDTVATFAGAASFTSNVAGYNFSLDDDNYGSGGAIYNEDATITFNSTAEFKNNTASGTSSGGGAVYNDSGTISFNGNTTFDNNTAANSTHGGGGIYSSGGTITFKTGTTTTFSNNKTTVDIDSSPNHGGGAYLSQMGNPNIGYDEEYEFGFISNGTMTFSTNTASGSGGGMYADGSAINFAGSTTFSGNTANGLADDEFGGGGIFAEGSQIVFSGTTQIQNNKAINGYGGGIFIVSGGMIDPDDGADNSFGIRFENGVAITGNQAENGGGLALDNSSIYFAGVVNISNNRGTLGGAIYAFGSDSELYFAADSQTTIESNTATTGGGAIYVDGVNLTIKTDEKAVLNINGGTGNEIYLASGSLLAFDAGEGSEVSLNSLLTNEDDSTEIIKKGIGTLYLNGVTAGNGSYTGSLSVQDGRLVLNGNQLSQADVTIEDGAILSGNGKVGNLTFNSEGELHIVVGGSKITADQLSIYGNAVLDIDSVASSYVPDTEYIVYTGVLNGAFENETIEYDDRHGKFWTFIVTTDEETGTISITGNYEDAPVPPDPPDPPDPPGPAPTPTNQLNWNQTQVAGGLAFPSGDLASFVSKLNDHITVVDGVDVYDSVYTDAVQQLAGTVRLNGLQLGLYSPHRVVFNRITLGSELYSGGHRIYNNGYGPIEGLENFGYGYDPSMYRGQSGDTNNPHQIDEAFQTNYAPYFGENNFWMEIVHVQTKTKSDNNSGGYGISRTGALIGMDFQKKSTSRIGAVVGFFMPYLFQNQDKAEAEDYHAGLYFQKNIRSIDFTGYFGYAHQEYDTRRYVNMGIIDPAYGPEWYRGKTNGDTFAMSLEMSKPRYYGKDIVLRPLIGLDYIETHQAGYTDKSDDVRNTFALIYNKVNYEQLFFRVGMNLKKETAGFASVFRLQYINQVNSDPYSSGEARFVQSNSAILMNFRGVDLCRDYLNLGTSLNLFTDSSRSRLFSFDYDANMSRRTTSHAVSLVFAERF
jgi:predicted outer membrane repeat protein/autotransporter-associated beta strand protein